MLFFKSFYTFLRLDICQIVQHERDSCGHKMIFLSKTLRVLQEFAHSIKHRMEMEEHACITNKILAVHWFVCC